MTFHKPLLLLNLALFFCVAILGYMTYNQNRQIQNLESEISSSNSQLNNLERKVKDMSYTLDDYDSRITDLESLDIESPLIYRGTIPRYSYHY